MRRSRRKPAGARRSAPAAVAQRIDASIRIARRLERSGHFRSAARAYLRLAEDCRRVARMATLELGTSICRAGNATIRAGRGHQGAALLTLALGYVDEATGDLVPDARATFRRTLARAHLLAEKQHRV